MSEEGSLIRLRLWMNEGSGRLVCWVLAGALLLGAVAVFFTKSGRGEADDVRRRGLGTRYICTKCVASDKVRFTFGRGERMEVSSKFPIDCPKCGAPKAAVQAVVCIGCGEPFAASSAAVFSCPHCKKVYDNRLQPE